VSAEVCVREMSGFLSSSNPATSESAVPPHLMLREALREELREELREALLPTRLMMGGVSRSSRMSGKMISGPSAFGTYRCGRSVMRRTHARSMNQWAKAGAIRATSMNGGTATKRASILSAHERTEGVGKGRYVPGRSLR
jgi:hypothetical protein